MTAYDIGYAVVTAAAWAALWGFAARYTEPTGGRNPERPLPKGDTPAGRVAGECNLPPRRPHPHGLWPAHRAALAADHWRDEALSWPHRPADHHRAQRRGRQEVCRARR